MKSVTKLHRSSAIQAYRELVVWDYHPLVIGAVRAHAVLQGFLKVGVRGSNTRGRSKSSVTKIYRAES